jgi:hypothetical protein
MEELGEVRLVAGDRLERYRIESFLGRGGMGVVYAAHDPRLDRKVALKIMRCPTEQDTARLVREARACAALEHPNAVGIHDVGEALVGGKNLAFIAMELVHGKTLRQMIGDPSVPSRDKLGWLLDIARALAAAHKAGLVHRDVKPENVMVRDDGVLKVLDFGVARRLARPTDPTAPSVPPSSAGRGATATATATPLASKASKDGARAGTPLYMTPEQIRFEALDGRTDQFAWGVVAFELFTGRVPWNSRDEMTLVASILTDVAPALSVPDLPPIVGELVARALSKSPSDRLPSMDAIVDALEPLFAPVDPRVELGTTRPVVSQAPPRSKRGLVGGALVAGLALSAAAYVGLTRSPLAKPDAVLACPPLAARGVEAPAGWLGAAAADEACRRAALLLGGSAKRTRSPAELAGIPSDLSGSVARDPFGDPDARARLMAKARAQADAWIDGSVEAREAGFSVSLALRDPDGETLARAEGSAEELDLAVGAALDGLVGRRAIPAASALEAGLAARIGTQDPKAAIAIARISASVARSLALPDTAACASLDAARATIDADAFAALYALCDEAQRGTADGIDLPNVDRASVPGFLRTLPLASRYAGAKGAAFADEARALYERESDPLTRASLSLVESNLAYAEGDAGRARVAAIRGAKDDPRAFWAWPLVAATSLRLPGVEVAAHMFCAWMPGHPNAWNIEAFSDPELTDLERVALSRRATALAPKNVLFALNLGEHLVAAGLREEARTVAARFAAGSTPERLGAETILARIEMSEAHYLAAFERARQVLSDTEVLGKLEASDAKALDEALIAGLTLGRATEVADAFAKRFVLADPPRLHKWGEYTLLEAAVGCALASPAIASSCFERLRKLQLTGFFRQGFIATTLPFLDGVEHFARGDLAAAVASLRPLAQRPRSAWLLSFIFDRAGEDELSARLDAPLLRSGITLAHVREAGRRARRGDHEAARAIADRVLAAWSVGDAPFPALTAMRAIVDRSP